MYKLVKMSMRNIFGLLLGRVKNFKRSFCLILIILMKCWMNLWMMIVNKWK